MKTKEHIVSLGQIELNASDLENIELPETLPVLATRDFVLFPGVTFPISLGRERSIAIAQRAEQTHEPIAIVCQRDADCENPELPTEIYNYGVVARVVKVFDIPDGPKTAILHALKTIEITGAGEEEYTVKVNYHDEIMPHNNDKEFVALALTIRKTALNIIKKATEGPNELAVNLEAIENPVLTINMVASHIPLSTETKVGLLRMESVKERGFGLLLELGKQEMLVELTHDIQERARQALTQGQRNAFLQSQLDAIRQELYGDEDEADKFRVAIGKLNVNDELKATFNKEADKLSRLNPQSPDYSVQYGYLDLLTNLPWGVLDPLTTDINEAEAILEEDHFGLEKVKERIIEQLAVMMNTPDGRSPIICLVGAPGVGKTSLGQSIARALGRKYQRVALGGLHDEAEIRGHRRTYIGAMPGRIIDAMRRAGTSNPVILLDEIDKMGTDIKSDPSAALLEVLDPEQNHRFHDNYVDVDFDLSKVLFIATANTLASLPQPLIDRMETIDISGYLLEEKIEIAKRHLIPRLLKANGFKTNRLIFNTDAIVKIIEGYTSESGVRQLEKNLASIVRKVVLKIMRGQRAPRIIKAEMIKNLLGIELRSKDRYEGNDYAGVVTGLAWTAVGGEILFVETSLAPGNGEKLTLTGNLGDVMKESATIALQYLKANADKLGIDPEVLAKNNIHVHVPEGAIPKDGPSAGITMATSIASALTKRKVAPRLAMTGEITLRGKVLPVGGIKEKILAAKRAGIETIVLSTENRKEIEDIVPAYLSGLTFRYVDNIGQVLETALLQEKAVE